MDLPDVELPHEILEGMALSSDEAHLLEQSLHGTPDDIKVRLRLIGFYLLASIASGNSAWLGSRHVLWLVRNHPEHPVLGTPLGLPVDEGFCAEVGRTWRTHLEATPRNVLILVHAARFFGQMDRPFAQQIRYRLQLIDPQRFADFSLDFPLKLAPADGTDSAATALAEPPRASPDLVRHAQSALLSGDRGSAERFAQEALASVGTGRAMGAEADLVHASETVLGHVALSRGDTQTACEHLRRSADVIGSPGLDTFGPEMSLARALVEEGFREAVVDYLERCRRFWKMGHALLDAWEADIFEGRMPNFLGNIRLHVKRAH